MPMKMNHFFVFVAVLMVSLLVPHMQASSQVEAANANEYCLGEGCLCKGSLNAYFDFTADLSFAFVYPVKNIGDKVTPDFNYTFSPCTPIACRYGVETAAICQHNENSNSPEYDAFNCGQVSKAAWTIQSRDSFTVTYRGGDKALFQDSQYIRESVVTFHVSYNTTEPNKIEHFKVEKFPGSPEGIIRYYFNATLNNKLVHG